MCWMYCGQIGSVKIDSEERECLRVWTWERECHCTWLVQGWTLGFSLTGKWLNNLGPKDHLPIEKTTLLKRNTIGFISKPAQERCVSPSSRQPLNILTRIVCFPSVCPCNQCPWQRTGQIMNRLLLALLSVCTMHVYVVSCAVQTQHVPHLTNK